MAPCKQRVSLSLREKRRILDDVSAGLLSKSDIANKHGIPKSSLSTIIKNREKILACDGDNPGRKRSREVKFPKLDFALTEWLRTMRGKNVPIDGNILKEKASDFVLRMGIEGFQCSTGWLQKFKLRHGLSFCKLSGESASADPVAASSWKDERLKSILEDYPPEDIFNADETGLMFKQLPDRTLVFKKEKCSGGKKAKSRITLLVCANMTGTEKLPLLVIGKAKKPRCFKGITQLPTKYKANNKAWMTAAIYEEWLLDLDRRMANKKRKIILVVDNCTAHVPVTNLQAITVEFLPPNLTCLLQPMDQGVIQNLKKIYRRALLRRIIMHLEIGKEYALDILGAIHLACYAWNQVTTETIAHCFSHAGFVCSLPSAETVPIADDDNQSNEDEALLDSLREKNMEIPLTFDEYVNSDADIVCIDEATDESILQAAQELGNTSSATIESSDEEEMTREPKPTTSEVLKAVDTVRRLFEEEDDAQTVLHSLAFVEKRVLKCKKLVQPKITGFFMQK